MSHQLERLEANSESNGFKALTDSSREPAVSFSVRDKDDYDGALARASEEEKLVLLNFTGFT